MKQKIKILFTNKFFLGTFIATLVAIALGISYAYLTWNSKEDTNFTFHLGDVGDAIFAGGNEISSSSIGPVLSPLEGSYTEFEILKKSDVSFHVTIDFLPTVLPNILKDASFKYAIYRKTNEMGAYSYVTGGNFLNKVEGTQFTILSDDITMTTYYKLIIYLDGNMENATALQGQDFAGKVLIY